MRSGRRPELRRGGHRRVRRKRLRSGGRPELRWGRVRRKRLRSDGRPELRWGRVRRWRLRSGRGPDLRRRACGRTPVLVEELLHFALGTGSLPARLAHGQKPGQRARFLVENLFRLAIDQPLGDLAQQKYLDRQLARHRALGAPAAEVAKRNRALVHQQLAQRGQVRNVLELEPPRPLVQPRVLDERHRARRHLLGPHPLDQRHRRVARAPADRALILGALDGLDVVDGRHVLFQVVEQTGIEHGCEHGVDGRVESVLQLESHGRRGYYSYKRLAALTLRMGPRMLIDIESSSTLPDTSTRAPSAKGPLPSSSNTSPPSVCSSQPPPNSLFRTVPL